MSAIMDANPDKDKTIDEIITGGTYLPPGALVPTDISQLGIPGLTDEERERFLAALHTQSDPTVVIVGAGSLRASIYGPFVDADAARAWINERQLDHFLPCIVAPLRDPNEE